MLPPSRQLLAHTYLLAAGLTGAILGYTVSRIEARFEIGAITKSMQQAAQPAVAVIDTKEDVARVKADDVLPPINSTQIAAEPIEPAPTISVTTVTPVKVEPAAPQTTTDNDDLELAARRLESRARTADRLGDPKLADMWKAEAARLRSVQADRIAQADTEDN